MYETLTFTGGVHRSDEVRELIEDLGGFILQDSVQQMELVLNIAVPLEDVGKVEEKAKELLNSEELSVTEIAISSGFKDIYHFCRVFKKVTGFSPSKYRKMHKNKT